MYVGGGCCCYAWAALVGLRAGEGGPDGGTVRRRHGSGSLPRPPSSSSSSLGLDTGEREPELFPILLLHKLEILDFFLCLGSTYRVV